MRKIFTLMMLLICMGATAKVVKITLADGSSKVFASAELESIDFEDDGTIVVTTYDGQVVDLPNAKYEEVEIDDDPEIFAITDSEALFPQPEEPASRKVKRIDFLYPSVDPLDNPVTLSGSIMVPEDIWKKQTKCDGIILSNHFTSAAKYRVPTKGFMLLEGLYLACPLGLNYIVVASDFYGFGATERYPQAFTQGTANGHANIDALLVARDLLKGMGINYGSLLFNIGYSSGGFDALSTLKVRDMEHRDEVWFDKTFAGGGPYDLVACYKDYLKTDTTGFPTGIALLVAGTNESQKLGLDYKDLFQDPIGENMQEWVLSKEHDEVWIKEHIREVAPHVSDMFQPVYCDLSTPEARAFTEVLKQQSLTTGWKPDPTQKIYLAHSRDDNYVPFAGAKSMLDFLKAAGYNNNIYAGRSNLQANFAFKKLGHIETALIYMLESLFAMKAWPTIYDKNHQLKAEYEKRLARENSIATETISLMNDVGIDTKWLKSTAVYLSKFASQVENNAVLDPEIFFQAGEQDSDDDSDSNRLGTLVSLISAYNSLLPDNDAEEALMDADCGSSAKVYLRRLRRLLVMIGIIN